MKKAIMIYLIGCLVVIIILGITIFITENKFNNQAGRIDSGVISQWNSKAEIVAEINQLRNRIIQLEKESGISGKEGFTVYPAAVSTRLYALYEALSLRLHFLTTGRNRLSSRGWEEYPFQKKGDYTYSVADVFKVIADLKLNGVPDNFLENYHIFLLPYTIPEISGLGGAGYAMISATMDKSPELLAVTLNHEIGHHIHLSFMPEMEAEGKKYWAEYLGLRDADWHGPGKVNTMDWSNSSEETFAEDFRMLFGKEQPYYNDLALGDPRADTSRATLLKEFMISLAKQPIKKGYGSPWIPSGAALTFWRLQGLLITIMWGLLWGTGLVLKIRTDHRVSFKISALENNCF